MSPVAITVNIPVRELERAVHFYTQLGFESHPVFRGPDCQCMVVTEQIRIMLHLDSSLKHFTSKPILDPSTATGVVLCLDCNSKAEVDDLIVRAVASGGSVYDAAQDLGFVYTHGFFDADGNVWRLNFMDPNVAWPE